MEVQKLFSPQQIAGHQQAVLIVHMHVWLLKVSVLKLPKLKLPFCSAHVLAYFTFVLVTVSIIHMYSRGCVT